MDPGFIQGSKKGRMLEYIPGYHKLIEAKDIHGDIELYTLKEKLVLWVSPFCHSVEYVKPYVEKVLQLWMADHLPKNSDGRVSAGPLDVPLFLESIALDKSKCQNSIDRILHTSKMVNIHPSGRKAFVGDLSLPEEYKRASYFKGWKGNGVTSWSGGYKSVDRNAAEVKSDVVKNQLSKIEELANLEHHLHRAAEYLWSKLVHKNPAVASEMLEYTKFDPYYRLGNTGWTSFSVNINYQTACHIDTKNVPNSYSALIVMESHHNSADEVSYLIPMFCWRHIHKSQFRRKIQRFREDFTLCHNLSFALI